MIAKGKSRSAPLGLAAHLLNAEMNEKIRVVEVSGTVAQDVRGALIEMDAYALGTKCQKPLYHAALSPEPPHRLTDAQRAEAVDALEKKLGFDGHARVVVIHEKEGREHLHVVWTRIDIHHMRAVSDSHNYRKHEEVCRDLERRFGHERVQGAHHERQGADGVKTLRPDRTPSRAELRQEQRTGIKGKDVKLEVTDAFKKSDGPEAFRAALAESGYALVQGDRRDFVIIDRKGGIHSLARRLDGVNTAQLREFMEPLNRESVPTLDAYRQLREFKRDAKVRAGYGKGNSYATQSLAALKDVARKDKKRRQRDRAREAGQQQPVPAPRKTADVVDVGGRELSDEMQAKLDAFRAEVQEALNTSPDPNRQNEAPGGGHTRSQ